MLVDAPVSMQIYNIDGKLVSEKNEYLSSGQHEIQMSGLDNYPPGFYSYSIASEGMIYRGKLIKK
jgi:hypothetical protein